ncbi:hypothetical protein HDU89_001649 [Geranomyces variabilis]|nr:hypothetical protein HDU89_001649 [Geranomyces variabilis]
MSPPKWSDFLLDAERDVKARLPKAKPGRVLDEIIKAASATKSKGHDWPKKLAVDTVKASFAAAKKQSRRNKSTGSDTSNTTTITATNSVVVLGDQARVTVSPTRQAAALPIAAQTPTKVQATSLGLGPIGSLAHKIHNAVWASLTRFIERNAGILDHAAHVKHANQSKSAPGKESMTAQRRTWDLADGLRFVKSNMDKLAKSLAVTAFAGPNKGNPSRLLQYCISDRNEYAHVMLGQGEAAVLDEEVGAWIGHGRRLAVALGDEGEEILEAAEEWRRRLAEAPAPPTPLTELEAKSRRLEVELQIARMEAELAALKRTAKADELEALRLEEVAEAKKRLKEEDAPEPQNVKKTRTLG